MKPLMIELFAGLHGWGEGAVAAGYRVIGYDIVDMCAALGRDKPQGIELVLQDVRTLHGSQFKDAALIVASPPCQEFSYMAMPWSRAKQIQSALLGQGDFPEGYTGSRTKQELTALFDACFRIQREAIEAAGHFIPMVVENVRGAQKWVGKAPWNYGSFYLWGDVPALMPITERRKGRSNFHIHEKTGQSSPAFNGAEHESNVQRYLEMTGTKAGDRNINGKWTHSFADSIESSGYKTQGMNWSDQSKRGQDFTRIAAAQKNNGGSWFNIGSPGQKEVGKNPVHEATRQLSTAWRAKHYDQTDKAALHLKNQAEQNGFKGDGGPAGSHQWFGKGMPVSSMRKLSSKSPARKAASALIAKIPFSLAHWIARAWKPGGIYE